MSDAGKKTVLLVEDEAIIAMSQSLILRRNGYTIITASNAERAVAAVQDNTAIDLVLMDINLGSGVDGTVAAQRILALRDLPVVFLSSHTEKEVVETTEGITSYGYIVKNSGETVLLASIRMAFRLFEAKQQEKEKSLALIKKMDELERIHRLTVDRELAMIGLKKEINELMIRCGEAEKYTIAVPSYAP